MLRAGSRLSLLALCWHAVRTAARACAGSERFLATGSCSGSPIKTCGDQGWEHREKLRIA